MFGVRLGLLLIFLFLPFQISAGDFDVEMPLVDRSQPTSLKTIDCETDILTGECFCRGDHGAITLVRRGQQGNVGDHCTTSVSCDEDEVIISSTAYAMGSDESAAHLIARRGEFAFRKMHCRGMSWQAGDRLHFLCQIVCAKKLQQSSGELFLRR